jgi:hypothetical protein
MTRRAIAILDILVLALFALAVVIAAMGGFVVYVGGVRISLRFTVKVVAWLLATLALRIGIDRARGPFGWSWSRFGVAPQPDPFQVQTPRGLWRRTLYASIGLAAALAVLLHAQIANPSSVPDYGDPLFSIWRVGWVLHQLANDPRHLFDANIFYPQPLTLTFSDPMILPALTAAPFLALGIHPVIVYTMLFVSGFWLSGIATYVLVERLTWSPKAAFIAGLMYACQSFRFDHYSHLESQMTQWMPLGLLALHMFVATERWSYAVALALAIVAQLYSSMYYAVFFVVYGAVIGIGLLIVHRPTLRAVIVRAAVAAAIAVVIAIPLVRAFAAAQPVKGDRGTAEIQYYSATPLDYVSANAHSALYGRVLPPAKPERALFPGAVPLALAAVGLAPPISAIRLVYVAGLLISLDGSFGLNGVFYPALHDWFAPVRGLRSPARFSVLVALTLCIFAGFGVRRLLRAARRSRFTEWSLFLALIVAVLGDAWPTLTLLPVWKQPPAIYRSIDHTAGVVLAEFPIEANEVFNIPYMYFSTWHWRPMINGYSGFIPSSYASVSPVLATFPNQDAIAELRRRGVTHVTINCGLKYAGCDSQLASARESTDLRLIAETVWEGAPVALFELAR